MNGEPTVDIKKDENRTEEENSRVKVIMARAALILIAVFIVAACIGMAFGSREVMFTSLFLVVFVPIIIYCFILVYDKTHGKSKRERKAVLEDNEEDEKDLTQSK